MGSEEQGPRTEAARMRAQEHRDTFEDTMDILARQIQELSAQILKEKKALEDGDAYKKSLTGKPGSEQLIAAAEDAGIATARKIVELEEQKQALEERQSGLQRPLN